MERKNIPFEIKAIEEDGSFIAYGSTFGNEDLGGDVVVKGAFKKSIQSKNVDDILLLHQLIQIILMYMCVYTITFILIRL